MSSTRRDFLAATAVVGFTGAARAQHEPVAFALIGDRYHNSDHYRTAFGKTFVRDMGLAMDFSDEVKLLNPDHLSRYRVLIILRDGMIWPDGHGNPRIRAALYGISVRPQVSAHGIGQRGWSGIQGVWDDLGGGLGLRLRQGTRRLPRAGSPHYSDVESRVREAAAKRHTMAAAPDLIRGEEAGLAR